MGDHGMSMTPLPAQQMSDMERLVADLRDIDLRVCLMCNERRGPRLSIPAKQTDDDVFIHRTVESVIAELERLRAEREEMRKDAERYRFLRDDSDPDSDHPYITRHLVSDWGNWRNTWEHAEAADAHIDAALTATHADEAKGEGR
jgi:hypothetical protein